MKFILSAVHIEKVLNVSEEYDTSLINLSFRF